MSITFEALSASDTLSPNPPRARHRASPVEFLRRIPWRFLSASALAGPSGWLLWNWTAELDHDARVALIVFAVAIIFWIVSRLDKTFIAIAALCAGAVTSANYSETTVLSSLGEGMIGLLMAAFVLAGAITASGLADRFTGLLIRHTRSVGGAFYALTAGMIALAMVMPSTSGRAALMLPVFLAIADRVDNPRVTRALALLIPTIVLLSSAGSLIGAGANVLAADAIWRLTGERIDYLGWMVLGLPFAVLSCFLSAWVILALFLNKGERDRSLDLRQAGPGLSHPLSFREHYILLVAIVLVALWCTESLHGIDNVTVALLGALAVTAPGIGAMNFKQAIKSVDWTLLLFMAACLQLGDALVTSGGAEWTIDRLFQAMPVDGADVPAFVAVIATLCLLAHLVVTSRMARASILVPMILPIAMSFGYNPAAFAMIVAIATGFCLTLSVSAKPLAMMSELDRPTFRPGDLLVLSAVLLPLHLGLLLVFSIHVWPWMGLPLAG